MATYPTPSQGGPQFSKYLKEPEDWKAITVSSEFEDGARDFLVHASTTPQYYDLEYNGLPDTQASTLDSFWDAHGLHTLFDFIEPRNHPWTGAGSTVTGCRFASYERDHVKVWGQKRTVRIVKYPT